MITLPPSRAKFSAQAAPWCFLLAVLFCGKAFAQLDSVHFVPPVYYSLADGGGDRNNFDRHYLVISTPFDGVDLKVTNGAGEVIIDQTISNDSPLVHLLGRVDAAGAYQASAAAGTGNVVGDSGLARVVAEGLIVEASAAVYVNVRHQSGYQGGSLTAKGCAALGQEFRVATMRNNDVVHHYRSLFFSVMATEDDTVVSVDDIKDGIVFTGLPASGTPLTTDDFSITLDRGESYVVGVRVDAYAGDGGTASLNDVNGTRVRSNKPVVVNSGTILGCPDRNNVGSRDMGFDQIAPVTRAGREYLFVKGSGLNGSDLESPTVVAVEDGTNLFLNGSLTPVNESPLNAGDYYFISGEFAGAGTLFLETNKPVLAWQTMAGANSPATPGLNFVPPLNKDIATKVDNIADIDLIGEATINIVAGAGESVTINGRAPQEGPLDVPGTSDWVLYRETGLKGNPSVESSGAIAVSLVMLKNPIGAGAYYSGYPDFKPLVQLEDPLTTALPGIVLNAIDPSGGIFTDFEWFSADGTSTGVTGMRFEPELEGSYYVVATSATHLCPATPSALFEVVRYSEADLQVQMTLAGESFQVGQSVTVDLTVVNHGPDAAQDVLVTSVVPEGLEYVPGTMTGGDVVSDADPDGYGLVWKLDDMSAEAGESEVQLSYEAEIVSAGEIGMAAKVGADLIESTFTNNETATDLVAEEGEVSEVVEEDCICPVEMVEFEIRDLDVLADFGIYPESYDAARDVWNRIKEVLNCDVEGVPLEEEKRGFAEEDFYLMEDSEVIVTVIYDGAAYYNSVCYYDAGNPGETWSTVWESFATGPLAPLIPGSSASLGVLPAGTELRFGLVMNGGLGGVQKIYQDDYLNPGGRGFMASNILLDEEDRPLIVAFEDQLNEGRDNDFNDVILKVDIVPVSLGVAQHDGVVSGQRGINSDSGPRGLATMLETHGVSGAQFESVGELFYVPADQSELTIRLIEDRSPMSFTLAAFDYDQVYSLNPGSLEFREIAAANSITLMDDRVSEVGDEVTINLTGHPFSGKTIGLMLIPNNTTSTFLTNPWRYTPRGNGERTKRQPLFSLNSGNPEGRDQMMLFGDGVSNFVTFEDLARLSDPTEPGEVSDDSFDDIQFEFYPALEPAGFHDGHYYEGSADVTKGFVGPDGFSEATAEE
ncbi:MAG: DUF4114 domain-containing protein [Verrucomicrobiota bacterium JB023]|nr:DUF4114 domain-containing protein [Verrucomicrobiota bacterium JB023]